MVIELSLLFLFCNDLKIFVFVFDLYTAKLFHIGSSSDWEFVFVV